MRESVLCQGYHGHQFFGGSFSCFDPHATPRSWISLTNHPARLYPSLQPTPKPPSLAPVDIVCRTALDMLARATLVNAERDLRATGAEVTIYALWVELAD